MSLTITRTDDLDTCLALRFAVFVEEQGVPAEIERDAYDEVATHLLATREGTPLGTARILPNGEIGKIGRVCVLREARGQGLGAALIEAALAEMRKDGRFSKAVLGAQITAIPFYEKLGFAAYGEDFDDAGIPHRMMERAL
ncbi:GNAT family N-acetyltransferase [Primorskyibacter aestuariivivens]|uniref:GNAT family N-acetyltransferase n=1 Tax=Primorskyibacter aestuariivivens TaxID=1888912 RepID=UPI0023007BD8|nr:GNAT family N-acetyltransferase [Primorskyibacter aestuariivivens]MDA7427819.1 GNAT family N-acetyltransferase [Primorskyibacter aestuariivivens]